MTSTPAPRPSTPNSHGTLTPILTTELQRLCTIAAEQGASATDLELLLGDATVAATLTRVLATIKVDVSAIPAVLDALPQRRDLILAPLALTHPSRHGVPAVGANQPGPPTTLTSQPR